MAGQHLHHVSCRIIFRMGRLAMETGNAFLIKLEALLGRAPDVPPVGMFDFHR